MCFTAQEVLLGGKERGRSGKSSYQLHIAYEPRQDPLSRRIPKLLHVQLPSHRASKLLLLPFCWWHNSSTDDLCVGAVFLPREMQGGMCMNFKIHLSGKKAMSRGGHLLYEQLCSKPAAGSGWQMDIFFLSLFLPPKQQERCCQAASVSAYSPR